MHDEVHNSYAWSKASENRTPVFLAIRRTDRSRHGGSSTKTARVCTAHPAAAERRAAPQPAVLPQGTVLSQQAQMIKAAFNAWVDDYAPSMGAALSYYTLFSLAPLLLIVIAVAAMVFGQEAAQGEIVAQLGAIMGADGAMAVEGMLKSARKPAASVLATIVGVALLLLGATAIFAELQDALDRIWRVPAPQAQSGIWYLLRTRLLSFGLVLGLGFMLTVSLIISAALAALGKWWGSWFNGWDVFFEILNFGVSLGIFTLLFAMIFKIMPRAKVPWRDVWTGAAVTALLFTIGKVLIGLYLGKSSLASGFGAAGSFVVLIAWVYYSALIFLFGAEYTWVYAHRFGSRQTAVVTARRTWAAATSRSHGAGRWAPPRVDSRESVRPRCALRGAA
jgi:membrane protein